MYITEGGFYSQRPLVQFILSGIFERHPKLKMVITETGCSWVPPLLKRLDWTISKIRDTGATGEIRYSKDAVLPKLASEYFTQNVWMGISQPGPADITAADQVLAPGRFMWGSDYPHDEGTHPFTREHLRQVMTGIEPDEMQKILAENCAKLYDFNLAKLAPLAAEFGPTVEELTVPLDTLPDNPNDALLRSVGKAL
jgi:predicted TIM-barrel fold metal-dependent hydrolase